MNSLGYKKKLLAVAVGSAVCVIIAACGGSGNNNDTQATNSNTIGLTDVRTVQSLNGSGWKFIQDDNLSDTDALAADGTAWTGVTLPHTWNALDAASTTQTTPTTASYKRGKGWYRLEFTAPAAGATQWLQFDAASIVADVWLNGTKLGQHKGAFGTFRFDITKNLKSGTNVLLVKTDNSAAAAATDLTAIMPLSGDFNMSGGLYRGVSLISTRQQAHFALDDYGSTGVYAKTSSVTSGTATVNVRSELKNDASADAQYTVKTMLATADGTLVQSGTQSVKVKAGAALEVSQDLQVANAHLWNGMSDPYLYKLVVEMQDAGGATIDRVVQNFGIRQISFTGNEGFYLNGKLVKLHGVNMHQDYYQKGWAISNADTDESMAIIKDIGANTVRLAHYPHADYTLQQTDKLGFVVWAEVPFVNQATVPCSSGTYTADFLDNGKQQLKEMIRQQYNHPSIAMWSVGNEVAQGGCALADGATDVIKALNTLAKAEDPSRPTTMAANNSFDNLGGITDIWAFNEYPLWYSGTSSSVGTILDTYHTTFPNQTLGVSEYGAGAAITHHSDNLTGADLMIVAFDASGRTRIDYQPEEYGAYVHEQDYSMMVARDYIWGTFVWNMFDFGSGIRHEGDIGGVNTKGLVTFDRKTKKDPFYFYKANWSSAPVVYIAGRRYADRNYATSDIKVYANTESVTLKVNGNTVGTMTAAQCPLKTCTFSNVALSQGSNVISAEGTKSGSAATDSITWTLDSDHAINYYISAGNPTTSFYSEAAGPLATSKRFGSDNYFTGGARKALPNAYRYKTIGNLGESAVPAEGRVWDLYREETTSGAGFTYTLKVTAGKTYRVTLGFVEPTATTAASRVFDVTTTTGGVTTAAITGLDVYATAGGIDKAIAQSFTVKAGADGTLALGFKGTTGKAMVSNIMVIQQ